MSLSSLLRGSFRCRPVALFIDIIQNLFGVDFGLDFLGSENLLYYAFLVYEVSSAQDAYCLAATGNLLTPATQLLKQSRFGVGDEGELKAFYEYYSILMEPWDGPAALLFSDGRYAGGMLDRNGLRPSRYTITNKGMMVVASEVGVMDFEPGEIAEKGRLQPGKLLLIDTQEGKIYYDGEIKDRLAKAHPYKEWLRTNRIQLENLKSGRRVTNEVDNLERRLLTFGYGEEDIEKTIIPMCVNGAEPVAAMGNDTPLAVASKHPQIFFNYFRQQFAQVTNPAIDPSPIPPMVLVSVPKYLRRSGSPSPMLSKILAPR